MGNSRENLTIFFCIILIVCCIAFLLSTQSTSEDKSLKISFLDVGQGDATLITLEDGYQILIDTGRGAKVLRSLGEVLSFSDRHIDTVIITHDDSDHAGGLQYVLESFDVENIIHSPSTTKSLSYEVPENINETIIDTPTLLKRGDTKIFFLWPWMDIQADDNTRSIVTLLQHKQSNTALLTGDASQGVENLLLKTFTDIPQIDILKAGHHGSKHSTSVEFLDRLAPEFVVISAGQNNPYGHPHPDVLSRLGQTSAKTYNTATDKTVTFSASGDTFLVLPE